MQKGYLKMSSLAEKKFVNKTTTAKGEQRAWVDLGDLKTLWFNTGTQCNLSCDNCYIESSPTNDRLVYLALEDVVPQFETEKFKTVNLIAFTGGEPFLNPNIIELLKVSLETDRDVLVLTNAYRVISRHMKNLVPLKEKYGDKLHLRISLDHYTKKLHEDERGEGTFDRTLDCVKDLYDQGFNISVAGRALSTEDMEVVKKGYAELLEGKGISLDLNSKLVVFPEMIPGEDVPEITTACWDILKKKPEQQMCYSERMIVRRKNSDKAVVLPCTLLAYDKQFELGEDLDSADPKVFLNHEFCAKFCVLGGSSCSSAL